MILRCFGIGLAVAISLSIVLGLHRQLPTKLAAARVKSPGFTRLSKANPQSGHSAPAHAARGEGTPVLSQVRGLLARSIELSPGDLGAEDELRTGLVALLTDANVAEVFAGLSDAERATEFGVVVFDRWARVDPVAAARWLGQQPNARIEQTYALANAVAGDSTQLETIERELPPGETRDEFLSDACRLVTPRDVARAAEMVGRISPGLTRMTALLALADDWSQRDPRSVGAWIAAEPDATMRDELVRVAAVAQTSKDPIAALEWTLTSTASPEGEERAIDAIYSQWSSFAPEAAQRFAGLLQAAGFDRVPVAPR